MERVTFIVPWKKIDIAPLHRKQFALSKNISRERAVEPQISPLRCASVEVTKGRTVLPGRVVAEQEPFFITLGGPKAHESSVVSLLSRQEGPGLSLAAPEHRPTA
jgi:hypothetical protein